MFSRKLKTAMKNKDIYVVFTLYSYLINNTNIHSPTTMGLFTYFPCLAEIIQKKKDKEITTD